MKKTSLILLAALCSVMLAQAAITPASFTKIDNPVKDGSLPDVMDNGVMIFGDYNNDGLLDIFYIGGNNDYHKKVGLFKNTGSQWEVATLPTDMPALTNASAVWIDYNNDGNLDLIVAGSSDGTNNNAVMLAFKNQGSAQSYAFVKDANSSFYRVQHESHSTQSMQVIDYNNDGWMDLAVTGSTPDWNLCYDWRVTTVYINQNGYFNQDQTLKTLKGRSCNLSVCDVNSDGLFDLFAVGYQDVTSKSGSAAGYGVNGYINNGNGFADFSGISFFGAECGAVFAIDANNDGYQDIVEIARNTDDGWNAHASVWLYDGTSYNKVSNCGIAGGAAVVSVGDVNNDGNMDIYYAGYPNKRIAYGNGDGTFTEDDLSTLSDLAAREGFLNLVDINGDNLLDIQANGYSDAAGGYRNAIALNTTTSLTNAAPTAPINLALTETENGYKLTWDMPASADDKTANAALRYNVMAVTSDGKLFAINPADTTTGKQKVAGGYISYLNTKFYEFKTKEFTKFFVQAIDGANVGSAFVAVQPQAPQQEITPASFTAVSSPVASGSLPDQMSQGSMIYGDYNNDGLIDIFYVGGDGAGNKKVGLLKNTGSQWETVALSADIPAVTEASAIWIDYNNDGNLDLIYTGSTEGSDASAVMIALKNMGSAQGYALVKDNACSFSGGVRHTESTTQSMAVIDYNNDGWMDVLVAGNPSSWNDHWNWRCTIIYINQKGCFQLDKKVSSLTMRNESNVYVSDVNSDGWFDLFYTGYADDGSGYATSGYWNGADGFSAFSGISFAGTKCGAVFSIDANNDGYQDMVQLCRDVNNSHANIAKVWLYNGSSYNEVADCGLTGGDAVISVGDVNNDGNMDILYAGWPSQKIAYGRGDGTFKEVDFIGAMSDFAARGGYVNFVDLNSDNLLDVQVNGYNDSKGYRNVMATNTTTSLTNAAPAAPIDFQVEVKADGYKLTWDMPANADDKTANAALRYNIIATNADGSKVFAINPADLSTGKQKVAGGYTPFLTSKAYEFKTKEFSKFYVQAIDGANVGSAFTESKLLVLDEAVDNTTAIAAADGQTLPVEIRRAFPSTDYFYTLCLPFDLSNDQLKTFFGEDYKLCYLESATVDNAGTTVNMTFADRTELVAGTPYLIKPSQVVAAGWTLDATIDATMNNAVTTGATMYGLYATSVTTPNAFYLQADKYLHPYSATTIAAAFRAYFTFGQALGVAPRAVFNFTNTPTDMVDASANANATQKMIIGGQLIIIRDGVKYNAQGQKL